MQTRTTLKHHLSLINWQKSKVWQHILCTIGGKIKLYILIKAIKMTNVVTITSNLIWNLHSSYTCNTWTNNLYAKFQGLKKKIKCHLWRLNKLGHDGHFMKYYVLVKKKGIKKVCNAKIHRFYVKWQKLHVAEDTYNISSF